MSAIDRAALVTRMRDWSTFGWLTDREHREVCMAMRHAADLLDADQSVLDAADAHHPVTIPAIAADCYNGNCDHDECPEIETEACAACMELAYAMNDEYVPDEALAENCRVCTAVRARREQG